MKPKVLLIVLRVQDQALCASVAEIANRLQDAFCYTCTEATGIDLRESYQSSRGIPVDWATKRIVECVKGQGNEVVGGVALTGALIDSSQGNSVSFNPNVAVLSDRHWINARRLPSRPIRWLWNLLGCSVAFITGTSCKDDRCVGCVENEVLCWSRFPPGQLCPQCHNSLMEGTGSDALESLAESLEWLHRNAVHPHSLECLRGLPQARLRTLQRTIQSVPIDDAFLDRWFRDRFSPDTNPVSPLSWDHVSTHLATIGIEQFDRALGPMLLPTIGSTKHVDSLLYLTSKRHRDHTKHQVEVALLGHFLLDVEVSPSKTLARQFADISTGYYRERGLDLDVEESDVRFAWTIAALLHDTGYPLAHLLGSIASLRLEDPKNLVSHIQLCEHLLTYYSDLLNPAWVRMLSQIRARVDNGGRHVNGMMADIRRELEASFRLLSPGLTHDFSTPLSDIVRAGVKPRKEYRRALDFDHGLWSAANFVRSASSGGALIDRSGSMLAKRTLAGIEEVTLAVALHNIPSEALMLENHPVAWLLRLCDELHEWNRPTLTNGLVGTEGLRVVVGPFLTIGPRLAFLDRLDIRFELGDHDNLRRTGWSYDEFVKSKLHIELLHKYRPCIGRPTAITVETQLPVGYSGR